jgi:hypothetical protein
MKWTLFLTVAIYVAAIGLVSANLSAKDKASINDGLKAAATLSDFTVVSFIGGGNRSTRRKPPTCCKSLTSFIT